MKGSTVKQYYLAIHSAFAYAVNMEILSQHPMDKLVMPRADKYEATFYNKDELNTLFEVFKGHKIELIVHIAAYYVSDYDENGNPKLYVETRLKTHSTRRTLPLIPHIEEILLEKRKMDKHYKKLGGKDYDTDFVCCDSSASSSIQIR